MMIAKALKSVQNFGLSIIIALAETYLICIISCLFMNQRIGAFDVVTETLKRISQSLMHLVFHHSETYVAFDATKSRYKYRSFSHSLSRIDSNKQISN